MQSEMERVVRVGLMTVALVALAVLGTAGDCYVEEDSGIVRCERAEAAGREQQVRSASAEILEDANRSDAQDQTVIVSKNVDRSSRIRNRMPDATRTRRDTQDQFSRVGNRLSRTKGGGYAAAGAEIAGIFFGDRRVEGDRELYPNDEEDVTVRVSERRVLHGATSERVKAPKTPALAPIAPTTGSNLRPVRLVQLELTNYGNAPDSVWDFERSRYVEIGPGRTVKVWLTPEVAETFQGKSESAATQPTPPPPVAPTSPSK